MNDFTAQNVFDESQSDFTNEVNKIIPVLAENNASILLYGEKGSGKSYIAACIHRQKCTSLDSFFEINGKTCSVEKSRKVFEKIRAAGKLNKFLGERFTLFLGCADRFSLELQALILNFIDECKKAGWNYKIISSAEELLEQKIAEKSFSEQLYLLMNSVVINVLPLRQRKKDVYWLSEYYRKLYCEQTGLNFERFSEGSMELLENYFFPGNIDELKNLIQHAFIVGEMPEIKADDFGIFHGDSGKIYASDVELSDKSLKTALDSFKKEYVTRILEENGWNQTKSAKILGIQRTYVIRLINELQIRRK